MSKYQTMRILAVAAVVALAATTRTWAEEADNTAAPQPPAAVANAAGNAPASAPAPEKGPPLPFHTIEGYGGGAITPMAYLVNPGDECTFFGKPAAAMSFVGGGSKNLDALTFTETLFGRVELGYGADRLGLGTLPSAIRNFTGTDIGHSDLWLHTWSVRGLLVKENDPAIKDLLGGFDVPAFTVGIHFKYNDSIADISHKLPGALTGIGYTSASSEDYTFTATKTFGTGFFGKPLITTAGLRLSEAADLGFLGFGDTYHATFEGNVAILPWDKVLIAYEFRQKTDPYGEIPGLIGGEDNWNAIDVGLILNPHSTFVAGWGHFGNLVNAEADSAWYVQMKFEF
jgi:hypothetical protein